MAEVTADYFDGRSARALPVILRWQGAQLQIRGEGIARDVPAEELQWSERTRHGPRVAHITGGGSLQARDAAAWDAWRRIGGPSESIVVSAQQSWRWTLLSVAGLGLLLAGLFIWGVPALSRAALLAIPHSVDRSLGGTTLASLDQHILQPSALSPAMQERVRDAFELALKRQTPGSVPAHTLVFRSSRIGPNAFALPGGTMVMTDQLAQAFETTPEVLTGVLAHELGHVQQRHGMRMVVQASVIGLVSSLVLGDFSTVLAGAPVMLGQQSYSRDAEREADAHSAVVLKAAGISPAVMVGFFEKMNAIRADAGKSGDAAGSGANLLGIAIASHPADEERIAFFRAAAARP
jgi:Zn-dependent protease with chaperone function